MKYRICLPWNGFFATRVYLWGNLRVRLATQRKSLRKFNLRPLATTCRSVWPGLKYRLNWLISELTKQVWRPDRLKCIVRHYRFQNFFIHVRYVHVICCVCLPTKNQKGLLQYPSLHMVNILANLTVWTFWSWLKILLSQTHVNSESLFSNVPTLHIV